MNQEHKIVLYQVEDTNIYVNVMFKEDTFGMTQKWAFRYESGYEFLADNDHSKSHKWRDLP